MPDKEMLGFSFSFRGITEITLCTLTLKDWSFYRSSTKAPEVYIYLLGTLISCSWHDSFWDREGSRTAAILSQAGGSCNTLKPPVEPCQGRLSCQHIFYLPCLLTQPALPRSCASTLVPLAARELLSLSNTFSLAGFALLLLPGARACAS